MVKQAIGYSGKNLLPSLKSGSWVIDSTVTVIDDYSFTQNATNINQHTYYIVQGKPNINYYVGCEHGVDANHRIKVFALIGNTISGNIYSSSSNGTFVSPSDGRFAVTFEGQVAGTYNFSNFYCVEGNAPTPFEPYQITSKKPLGIKSALGIKPAMTNPSIVTITSDFSGKIKGSTVENPNIFHASNVASILPPTSYVFEPSQTSYDKLKSLDGTSASDGNGTNDGKMANHVFSFDIISILERQFGIAVWGGASTIAQKVAIAKSLISRYNVLWYGYGSSPTGNKVSFKIWSKKDSAWFGSASHTSGTVSVITDGQKQNDESWWKLIDNDGFIYYLANSEISDGLTPSYVYSDYIQLALTVTNPFPSYKQAF